MARRGKLAEELKQTRPFQSASQEGLLAVLRTADRFKRGLSGVVGREGITLQQYNVLRILRGAGRAGLPTLEIADRMVEQAPGITRLLDRLDDLGMIRRERSHSDRRRVFCWIEKTGQGALERLDSPVQAWTEAAFGCLSDERLRAVIDDLDEVRDCLTDD